jgi:hypothetical protein
VGTAILEKLSQSPTFLSLASRVSAVEAGKAPLAGPVFTGTVTFSNDLLQPNATYIKGTLNGGATTRLFGLNSSNMLYIGGIDQTISSILFEIAQAPVATLSTSGVTINSGGLSITSGNVGLAGSVVAQGSGVYVQAGTNGTTGMVRAVAGSTAQHGYFNWINASQVQEAYIGNQAFGAPLSYVATYGHLFTGSVGFTDNNFVLTQVSGNPRVNFDPGDYLTYDRTGNQYLFNVASSPVLTISANGNINANGSVTAAGGSFSGAVTFYDGQFSLLMSGGTPLLNFDTGDYLRYDRTGNAFGWLIASAVQMTLGTDGLHVANSVFVTDSNFYLNISGSNPQIAVDSSDFILYNRASNQYSFNVANSAIVTMSAAGGGTLSVGDGNNAWGINGGLPTLQFDVGDYLQYDRAANKFNFFVAGTKVASLDGSGNMRLLGTLTQSTTP